MTLTELNTCTVGAHHDAPCTHGMWGAARAGGNWHAPRAGGNWKTPRAHGSWYLVRSTQVRSCSATMNGF